MLVALYPSEVHSGLIRCTPSLLRVFIGWNNNVTRFLGKYLHQ
jgi:hypothetical protein